MIFYIKFKPILISFLLLFLSLGDIGGQSTENLRFSNWQKKDGLPSNSTSAVVKDHLGFIWIATNDGLCRFDGPNLIKTYRKTPAGKNSTNSLQSDNIRTLFFDSQKNLWIGTRFGGLTKFNLTNNEWSTFRHDPKQANSISHDEILSIAEDNQNRIWVGTERGLNRLNPKTGDITRLPLTKAEINGAEPKAILKIRKDQNGWIWVGTWAAGLYLFLEDIPENSNILQFRRIQLDSDIAADNVWTIYHDNDGRHWVGTHGGGLFLMNLPKEASNLKNQQNWQPFFHKYYLDDIKSVNLFSSAFQDITQDKLGNIWIGAAHGLYRIKQEFLPPLNSKKKQVIEFEPHFSNSSNTSSIIGNSINCVFEDNQGLLWIATSDGLSQYNWHSNQFKNYYFPEDKSHLAYAPNFHIDKTNTIWAGSWKSGLLQYRLERDSILLVNENKTIDILGNQITTIYAHKENWLYVGSELGVTAINMKTLKTKQYPSPPWVRNSIQELFITCITVDKNGYIWFGTKIGLFTINPITKNYHHHEPSIDRNDALSDHPINYILQDSKDNIWVATYNGLNRVKTFSEEKIAFEHFFFNADNPEDGPVNNSIMTLQEIEEKLYIGTMSGVCGYNYQTEKFEAYNSKNQKYRVHSMANTLDNNLWLSTNEGLFFFDTEKQTFKEFDSKDGIISSTYRLGSGFTDKENNIYFAYSNGFTKFNQNLLANNDSPPPVYITDIEKMNRTGINLTDGMGYKAMCLEYDDYRVSFNIAALNYNRADKNQISYRLLGLEEKWNKVALGTPIVYTNLKPKEYTLEVKASNNDGVWNETGDKLTIIQHAAYWETWWFRLGIITCTGFIVFCIFSWYTNKIRKHNEALQAYNQKLSNEINQRKNAEQQLNEYNKELKRSNKDLEQFAYIASHDLKEPLRMIGNFSGLLSHKYKTNLDEDAFEYIGFIEDGVSRMSNLINSLLTYSRVGRKEGDYQDIKLKRYLEVKLLDLSQYIKEKNATVTIGTLPEIYAEKEQIGMVFFNLVHNALKFNKSQNPMVTIKEEKDGEEGFWKFSVQDNGIGIDKKYEDKIFGIFKRLHNKRDYEGTGIGLSLCQKIIFRHQGTIWIESALGEGTTFYFTIKKNLEKFDDSLKNLASKEQALPLEKRNKLGVPV